MHAFGDNDYERDVFSSYAARHGLNLRELFREVLAFRGASLPRATWHGRPFAPSSPTGVNLDDKVCLDCASDLVEASLFEWWRAKRPEAGLPGTHRTAYCNNQNCSSNHTVTSRSDVSSRLSVRH